MLYDSVLHLRSPDITNIFQVYEKCGFIADPWGGLIYVVVSSLSRSPTQSYWRIKREISFKWKDSQCQRNAMNRMFFSFLTILTWDLWKSHLKTLSNPPTTSTYNVTAKDSTIQHYPGPWTELEFQDEIIVTMATENASKVVLLHHFLPWRMKLLEDKILSFLQIHPWHWFIHCE